MTLDLHGWQKLLVVAAAVARKHASVVVAKAEIEMRYIDTTKLL